jgi:hypothetical protein
MTVLELKNYKQSLYTSLSRDLSEFEKNFLLISGGILAFSITFIKEIVEIDKALFLEFLYLSWGLIIISIALMMLTFLKSSNASDKLWLVVDDFLVSNSLFKDETILNDPDAKIIKTSVNTVFHKNKIALKRLRFLAVITFIFGVAFLAFYVSINLSNENENKSKNKSDLNNSCIIDSIEIFKSDESIKIILKYGEENKDTSAISEAKNWPKKKHSEIFMEKNKISSKEGWASFFCRNPFTNTPGIIPFAKKETLFSRTSSLSCKWYKETCLWEECTKTNKT